MLEEVFLLKESLLKCNKYIGLLQSIAYKEFISTLSKKTKIEDVSNEELKAYVDNLYLKTLQYSRRQEKYIKKHIINRGLDVNILEFDGETSENQELELLEFNIQNTSIIYKFFTKLFNLNNKISFESKRVCSSWEKSVLIPTFKILDEKLH